MQLCLSWARSPCGPASHACREGTRALVPMSTAPPAACAWRPGWCPRTAHGFPCGRPRCFWKRQPPVPGSKRKGWLALFTVLCVETSHGLTSGRAQHRSLGDPSRTHHSLTLGFGGDRGLCLCPWYKAILTPAAAGSGSRGHPTLLHMPAQQPPQV